MFNTLDPAPRVSLVTDLHSEGSLSRLSYLPRRFLVVAYWLALVPTQSLEGKEAELYEKKRKIRQALESGKPIPTELRAEEAALRHEIALEDDNTAVPRSHIDDEYANAGSIPPKVLITTSRDPSSRLAQFAKELKLVFPNSQRLNRGGLVVKDLIESARSHEFTDVILVHETRGEPDGLTICHMPYGPTAKFSLSNVVTRHDIGDKKDVGTVSQSNPHLIFENLKTKLGQRVANILKYLFPPAKMDSGKGGRVMTFANMGGDHISFRHHEYSMPKGEQSVELTEKGPRFEMKLYQIKLGTLDQKHAENEYVLRSYINSAKRQKLDDGGANED